MSKSSLVLPMLNLRVLIDTSLGTYSGVLRGADRSKRKGIGNLLLETFDGGWLLVKEWLAIKRRL